MLERVAYASAREAVRPLEETMLKLHDFTLSGHAHRARLMLSLLGLEATLVPVDLKGGAHKSEAFLRLNPLGQVPVLEDGDFVLADSTAILVYLAKRYGEGRWLPEAPDLAAQVQRWLSVAANELAHGPAAARLVTVFGAPLDHEAAKAKAARLLSVLDAALAGGAWLVPGAEPSIADVAMYSYVAHAPEGGVSLAAYPEVRRWLAAVEALPGFVGMPRTEV